MKKKGFTLIELIVVMTIMMVSIGIATPFFINYWRNAEFQKNDSYARTIYLAAESRLTYYRNSGQWNDFKELVEKNGLKTEGVPNNEGRLYAIVYNQNENTKSNDLVKDLIDFSSLDGSIYDKCIAIEIDIKSGEVYSTFYGSKCVELNYDQDDHDNKLTMQKRDVENRKKRLLGYYSVEDVVNVVNLKPTRLRITSINLINSETLSLNWSSNVKDATDVSYEIEVYHSNTKQKAFSLVVSPYDMKKQGWTNGQMANVTVKNAKGEEYKENTYKFPITYKDNKYSLVLDGMMSAKLTEILDAVNSTSKGPLLGATSTNISRFYLINSDSREFATAEDIYCTVKATAYAGTDNTESLMNEYRSSETVASNVANTMFGNGSTSSEKIISTFRHLSNIRYDTENNVTYVLNNKSMDWTSIGTGYYDLDENVAINKNGTYPIKWYDSSSDNKLPFPMIKELKQNVTFKGTSNNNTIKNLYINANSTINDDVVKKINENYKKNSKTKIPNKTNIGLFGIVKGKIENIVFDQASLDFKEDGFNSLQGIGFLGGKLEGEMKNVNLEKSQIDISSSTSSLIGVGTLVGEMNEQASIDSTQVEGDLTAQISNKTAVGGLVGFAHASNNRQISQCYNNVDVTSNELAGGIVGKAENKNGDKTNAFLSHCTNNGFIQSSSNLGEYFGGIVGYGSNIQIDNCISSPGAYSNFTFDEGKKDLLKGKYVGGIIGYGNAVLLQDCSTNRNGYVLGNEYVGGIAGGLSEENETITAPNLKVTTNRSNVIGNTYVGGIVGQNTSGTVQKCINNGVVAGYDKYVGGITGYNGSLEGDTSKAKKEAVVLNCTSNVSDNDRSIFNMIVAKWKTNANCVGGLIGYNNGKLQFNKEAEDITVKSVASIVVGNKYIGGLIGFNDTLGEINAHYSLIGGQVYGFGDAVGGAIGFNASPSTLQKSLTVQPRSIHGNNCVGGVIGVNMVSLSQDTEINSFKANNTLATIDGNAFIGGVIGYQRTYQNIDGSLYHELENNSNWLPSLMNKGSGTDTKIVVSQTNNQTSNHKLTINGKNESLNNITIEGNYFMGGIVGYVQKESTTIIKDCQNDGNLVLLNENKGLALKDYISSQEIGKDINEDVSSHFVGGIISVNLENTVIDHCSNNGTLSGFNVSGGIVGLNAGLIYNCQLNDHLGNPTLNYIGGIAGANIGVSPNTKKNYNQITYTAGTIQNCKTIENKIITGNSNVGGIVGYNMADACLVDNTSGANVLGIQNNIGGIVGINSGSIQLNDTLLQADSISSNGNNVGGIIGLNKASSKLVYPSAGDISLINNEVRIIGNQNVGGIIGTNEGNIGDNTKGSLVSHAKLVQAYNGNAGGIVGVSFGTISHVKNNASSVASNTGDAGGITAVNNETIENCINQGSVTSNNGYASGISARNKGTIQSCQVQPSGTNEIIIYQLGQDELGTIVSYNQGKVLASKVEQTSQVRLDGNASILGGIVGLNEGEVNGNKSITSMPQISIMKEDKTIGGVVGLNKKDVLGYHCQNDFTISNYKYLGGIVGQNKEGKITDCTYSGSIKESTASKAGNCYGGIVGLNEALIDKCTVDQISIDVVGVYTATSTSTTEQKETLACHVGGIAGKNNTTGKIQNSLLKDNKDSLLRVNYGMLGGVTGFNKGIITYSGSDKTSTIMTHSATISVKDLANKSVESGIGIIKDYVNYSNSSTQIDQLTYNSTRNKVSDNRLRMYIVSNGNLGGITSYNSSTGQVSYCVSGNWFLCNSSSAIGVGTGGIIGMNESEKDLKYVVNAAFVGRYISSEETNRFAGGIIGNQNNTTSSDWKISHCINYGFVYCKNSHYSGGIMGQWTGAGGTIEHCLNYGTLQTTKSGNWEGASGGIVAQLYHAFENNEYNIISCSNYGSIYKREGANGNGANDSAGILGNVTTFKVSNNIQGQSFKIQILDCSNEPGVEIYSTSMASGIFGFLSCDNPNNDAVKTISHSTENVKIRIERCRHAGYKMMGSNFATGIFGDRYGVAGWENTVVKDNYSVHVSNNNMNGGGKNAFPVFSQGNSGENSNKRNSNCILPENRTNNYYIEGSASWGFTNVKLGKTIDPNASGEAGNGMYEIGDLGRYILNYFIMYDRDKKQFFGASINPAVENNEQNRNLYGNDTSAYNAHGNKLSPLVKSNYCYIDENGFIKTKKGYNVGKVLFYIDDDKNYSNNGQNINEQYVQNLVTQNIINNLSNGYKIVESERTTWRSVEGIIKGTNKLKSVQGASATIGQGRIKITITPSKLYEDNSNVLCDPFAYDVTIKNKSGKSYTKRIYSEEDSFDIPTIIQDTKKENYTIQVAAVSQYEGIESSDAYELTINDLGLVLPKPDVRVELIKKSTNDPYELQFSLNNLNEFDETDDTGTINRFNNWKVSIKVPGLGNITESIILDHNHPVKTISKATINGNNQNTYTLQMSSQAYIDENQNSDKIQSSALVSTPITMTSYQPSVTLKTPTITVSGSSIEDMEINVKIKSNKTETPPIYRVDLIGTLNKETVTFASQDMLLVSDGEASVSFKYLPDIMSQASNINIRIWYASSGLGPFYTYHEVSENDGYSAKIYDGIYLEEENGNIVQKTKWKYVKSTTLDRMYDTGPGQNDFKNYQYKPTGSLFTWYDAPILENPIRDDNQDHYIFKWDKNLPLTSASKYKVSLTGTDNNGNQVVIYTGTDIMDRQLELDASDWNYTSVSLSVTRLRNGNENRYGLTSTQEFKVKQHLVAPGQPVIKNVNDNELNYQIQWSAIEGEENCKGYQIYISVYDSQTNIYGKAQALGKMISIEEKKTLYSQMVDLENYAGEKVRIYVVSLAKENTEYLDSKNGTNYDFVVPKRLTAPTVTTQTNWTYDLNNPIDADQFKSNGLTLDLTAANDSSIPPGGSTYLLKALVYEKGSAENELGNLIFSYRETSPVSMNALSASQYSHTLEGLPLECAGKMIVFYVRISSGGGFISSEWTQLDPIQLPYVRLAQPMITSTSLKDKVIAKVVTAPNLPYEERKWEVEQTRLPFDEVELANGYQFELNGKTMDTTNTSIKDINTQLRIVKEGEEVKVEELIKVADPNTAVDGKPVIKEEWVPLIGVLKEDETKPTIPKSEEDKSQEELPQTWIYTSLNYKVNIQSTYTSLGNNYTYALELAARIEITKSKDDQGQIIYHYELVLPDATHVEEKETGALITNDAFKITTLVKTQTLAKPQSSYVDSDEEEITFNN